VKKLDEFNPEDDKLTICAKKLLQKCAYAVISHQELSAQQVASYLMDYEDHFTSHQFRNLYWTSFEALINKQDPSPECYYHINDHASKLDLDNDPENSNNVDDDDNASNYENFDNITNLEETADDNHEDESGEITVTVDTVTNELIAKTSQVVDYQLRASKISNLSVWKFVTSVDKMRIRKRQIKIVWMTKWMTLKMITNSMLKMTSLAKLTFQQQAPVELTCTFRMVIVNKILISKNYVLQINSMWLFQLVLLCHAETLVISSQNIAV